MVGNEKFEFKSFVEHFDSRLLGVRYFYEVDAFPNLLEVFLVGARPEFNQLNNDRVIDDCMWLLRRSLNSPLLPRAMSTIRSNWVNEPYFLGSYSYLSVATEEHEASPELLARPIYNSRNRPTVFFAGEATDAFNGYTNGAAASGFRAAEAIIDYSDARSIEANKLFVALFLAISFSIGKHKW